MSRSLAASCGSLDNLNRRVQCGCKPCLRQMRCTELTLMPCSLAIAGAVQCVVSPGGWAWVAAMTPAGVWAASGGMRDGRVLSRSKPATPSVMKRSCHRQTAVLLTPAPRMISAAPQPSAVTNTIAPTRHASAERFDPPRSTPVGDGREHSLELRCRCASRRPAFRRNQGNPISDSNVRFYPIATIAPALMDQPT